MPATELEFAFGDQQVVCQVKEYAVANDLIAEEQEIEDGTVVLSGLWISDGDVEVINVAGEIVLERLENSLLKDAVYRELLEWEYANNPVDWEADRADAEGDFLYHLRSDR